MDALKKATQFVVADPDTKIVMGQHRKETAAMRRCYRLLSYLPAGSKIDVYSRSQWEFICLRDKPKPS